MASADYDLETAVQMPALGRRHTCLKQVAIFMWFSFATWRLRKSSRRM